MKLYIQFYSLIFSFVFGISFYFILDIFNKYIYKFHLFLRFLLSLFFVLAISLLHFFALLSINNGYLHFYFLLSILFGYLFGYFIKKITLHKNKKSKM